MDVDFEKLLKNIFAKKIVFIPCVVVPLMALYLVSFISSYFIWKELKGWLFATIITTVMSPLYIGAVIAYFRIYLGNSGFTEPEKEQLRAGELESGTTMSSEYAALICHLFSIYYLLTNFITLHFILYLIMFTP